jgi:3-dehydroquinate dehydratase-1
MKFPSVHPAVIGSITTPAGLRLLARKSLPADAVEVRVDALLKRGVTADKIEAALRGRKLPVLLTLRIPAEGGHRSWKLTERRALYLRLLPHAEAIDVELATADALSEVLVEAIGAGKTVVVSAHALGKAAAPKQFAHWLENHGQRFAHTILKVASHIGSWRDLQRLAALLVNNPEKQIAVMGLGPHASQSRAVLAALGSRLVYGWLDKPAAPGQPSVAEVRKMVDALPPRE